MFRGYLKILECYLADYASGSLIQLKLARHPSFRPYPCIFEIIQKPFNNLESLCVVACEFGSELPFNRIFPNLKYLKLGKNSYHYTSAIRLHFSALTDLALHDPWSLKKFDQCDVKELLRLNPQLEKLELCLEMKFGPQFITWIKEACPNLQHLGFGFLNVSFDFPYEHYEPCDFNQIEKLTLKKVSEIRVPFTFSKLKYLELDIFTFPISSRDISELIVRYPHLISLKLEVSTNLFDLNDFFRIEHLLLNFEELRIEILNDDIPSDDLMHFLTRNRSLKRFSLRTLSLNFHHVYNAIMFGNSEFKIRNKAIEFNILRTTDNCSKTFVFRELKMLHYSDISELCTYDESRHLLLQKYDEYEKGLITVLKKTIPKYCGVICESTHIALNMSDFYF